MALAKLLGQMQRGLGRCIHQIHRVVGFTATYRVMIDRTADPFTYVTFSNVPLQKTALVKRREPMGGRQREVPAGGGLFTTEQQPYFVIGREALKVKTTMTDSAGNALTIGTYYRPTIDDEFTYTDDNGDTITARVSQLIEVSSAEEAWTLAYNVIFRESAHG